MMGGNPYYCYNPNYENNDQAANYVRALLSEHGDEDDEDEEEHHFVSGSTNTSGEEGGDGHGVLSRPSSLCLNHR